MKLTIVLPCYNEIENIALIPSILEPELKNLGLDYEILVIDDGSSDGSAEKAEALGVAGLKVIRHEKNRGLGAAVKTAIANANSDLLVILDSDFTFQPRYVKDLLVRFEKGDVDFVIGSPRLDKSIRKYRVLISLAASAVYSLLLGRRITAVSPIFRLYKTADLKALALETDGFDISVEILFRLILTGKKFAEVPTPLGMRQFGYSKLNYKKEMLRHLFLVRKIIGWRLKSLFKKLN